MNSLRRDLIERRLWPLVVVIIAAAAAVPFLLRKEANAQVTGLPPAPAAAVIPRAITIGAVAPSTHFVVDQRVRRELVRLTRDPFAGVSTLSATSPAAGSSKTPASPGSATAASAVAASAGRSTSAAAASSPAPASTPPASSPTTSTPPASTTPGAPASTPTTVTRTPASVNGNPESWTVYSVDVRYSAASTRVYTGLERLAPLPSASAPAVMYMGVWSDGRSAVFMLGSGVQQSGQGRCIPSRDRCKTIVLSPGQTETFEVATPTGWSQQTLRLAAIHKQAITSAAAAQAAFERHSAVGLCELALDDPLLYSSNKGTIAGVEGLACHGQRTAVPFPGGQ